MKRHAFTLLELLLYVSLSAILMMVISLYLADILDSRVKNTIIAEVDQQGMQIIQYVNQVIRNSDGINSPTPGTSSNSLSVNVTDAASDPTLFSVVSSSFSTQAGAGPILELSNSNVSISGLSFKNLSYGTAPDSIHYEFTVTYNNGNRDFFDYSKTFYASASLY